MSKENYCWDYYSCIIAEATIGRMDGFGFTAYLLPKAESGFQIPFYLGGGVPENRTYINDFMVAVINAVKLTNISSIGVNERWLDLAWKSLVGETVSMRVGSKRPLETRRELLGQEGWIKVEDFVPIVSCVSCVDASKEPVMTSYYDPTDIPLDYCKKMLAKSQETVSKLKKDLEHESMRANRAIRRASIAEDTKLESLDGRNKRIAYLEDRLKNRNQKLSDINLMTLTKG